MHGPDATMEISLAVIILVSNGLIVWLSNASINASFAFSSFYATSLLKFTTY